MTKVPFVLTITAILICWTAGGAEPQMTKIVTRAIGPAIKTGSFAAQPKTMYLAGKKYARMEEETDVQNRIHELVVINEPDTWLINLADNTGRHVVDPGPTFDVHSPIFWTAKPEGQPDPDKEFKDLEFGSEMQFFRERGAQDVGMRQVEEKNCRALALKKGSREVTLLFDPNTSKPCQIDISNEGKPEFSIRYLEYKTGLPFQKSLFEPPKGVTMTEANSSKAGYVGVVGRYEGLAAWARQDNQNSEQFVRDLRKARSAQDVALALKESAQRQQKTTDELVRLVHAYPELRNVPQLGLDDEGLRMWEQAHPDARKRQASLPPDVVAIQQQMHRSNTMLYANGRTQPADVLRKYRDNPEVVRASKELGQVLAENRRKLLEVLR